MDGDRPMTAIAVAVAGMHRSGTSAVAHALHLSGVHLGDPVKLMPPDSQNVVGCWEHLGFVAVNDEVLGQSGGGWDLPPRALVDSHDPRLDRVRADANALIETMDATAIWAWKDPRNSLTLPFWQSLVPGLRTVVCVRNPLEVALSLQRLGAASYVHSIRLWQQYYEALDRACPPGNRLVVHFEAALAQTSREVTRLIEFVGLEPSAELVAAAAAAYAPAHRHLRLSTSLLREVVATAPEVVELYLRLIAESGWSDPDAAVRAPARALDTEALDRVVRERDLAELRRGVADRDDRIAALEQQLAHEAGEEESKSARVLADLERRAERLYQQQAKRMDSIATKLERLDPTIFHRSIQGQLETVQSSFYRLSALAASPHDPALAAYVATVQAVRELVRATLPIDAQVLVVSRGDDALLDLFGRRAAHFPQSLGGRYAGFYPAGDLAAIAHLEALRASGAHYLLVPSPSAWWLDHYRGFAEHLRSRYQTIVDTDDATLFALRTTEAGQSNSSSATAALQDVARRFRRFGATEPAILDIGTGIDIVHVLPGAAVLRAPTGVKTLPYFDASIDVVVAPNDDPVRLAEARRIAAVVVVVVGGRGRHHATEWKSSVPSAGPSVSVIVPFHGQPALTNACLTGLMETLPDDIDVQVLLVDDASSERDAALVGDFCEQLNAPITLLRNPVNLGFLRSVNAAARLATGDVLVLLNNDTVPLPGWLPPLLETLERAPSAGAVCGKLVYPDGTLQEAGCVVFADGSAAKIGCGDPDPARSLYGHVREVDYGSGALLATPRALFLEVGCLDERYDLGYYEDVDYCFALRAHGYRVYFQPNSVVVHVEGGTAGTDVRHGMKSHQVRNQAKFADKWRANLTAQPVRPNHIDHTSAESLVIGRPAKASRASKRANLA